MVLRLLAALAVSAAMALACDCEAPPVKDKLALSDVVFRGTIVALRDAKPGDSYQGKIAVFRVMRVWKGSVTSVFQMPAFLETSACIGFWPSFVYVGSELLVYASRLGGEYMTSICGDHLQVKDADADLRVLGAGSPPK